jgi:hypothetical protein
VKFLFVSVVKAGGGSDEELRIDVEGTARFSRTTLGDSRLAKRCMNNNGNESGLELSAFEAKDVFGILLPSWLLASSTAAGLRHAQFLVCQH